MHMKLITGLYNDVSKYHRSIQGISSNKYRKIIKLLLTVHKHPSGTNYAVRFHPLMVFPLLRPYMVVSFRVRLIMVGHVSDGVIFITTVLHKDNLWV